MTHRRGLCALSDWLKTPTSQNLSVQSIATLLGLLRRRPLRIYRAQWTGTPASGGRRGEPFGFRCPAVFCSTPRAVKTRRLQTSISGEHMRAISPRSRCAVKCRKSFSRVSTFFAPGLYGHFTRTRAGHIVKRRCVCVCPGYSLQRSLLPGVLCPACLFVFVHSVLWTQLLQQRGSALVVVKLRGVHF